MGPTDILTAGKTGIEDGRGGDNSMNGLGMELEAAGYNFWRFMVDFREEKDEDEILFCRQNAVSDKPLICCFWKIAIQSSIVRAIFYTFLYACMERW